MKILQAVSEVVPFAKTGGLADVAGALPLALEDLGQEVIIAMPRYKAISDSKFKIQRLKEGISYSVIGKNIKVYFIENDLYFNRDGLYGDKAGDFKDNLERFSYYSKRVLLLLKEINFKPDIIHVHGNPVSDSARGLRLLIVNRVCQGFTANQNEADCHCGRRQNHGQHRKNRKLKS